MLFIVLFMVFCLLAAGVVAAYVAFPRRGVDLPVVPAAGDALARFVDSLPTVEPVGSHGARGND
ncbi:hypothetical protein [Nocardioides marmoribigeumensis]|uniref:Uncharacterized protein n=1 Tax=Nocardioides marmoribigeumensis TaxID=433649 RepID=A0ABU2BS47_9ACTN|nr:hypothetical protein [Nocardioides marmoribigeumensis]MDR7361472.1 hypothetical protein [Nocardioides marmoribigeumensis]